MNYTWPGNVRELKSAFEFAFVSCQGTMVEPGNLPLNIFREENVRQDTMESLVSINDIKKKRLIRALQQANGNQSEAARLLGLSRTSIWDQMKRFKIQANKNLKK